MRRGLAIVVSLMICLALTGCWDQQPLRALHMVDIVGVDLDKDTGLYRLNLLVSELNEAFLGGGKPDASYYEATSRDFISTTANVEREMSGSISLSNNRIYLFNKAFASERPGASLDFIGKVTSSPLMAKVGIVEGTAANMMQIEKLGDHTLPNHLVSLIGQAVQRNHLPEVRLGELLLSKQGVIEDIAVPLLALNEDKIVIKGVSLFSGDSYSGIDLNPGLTQLMMAIAHYRSKQSLFIPAEQDTILVLVKKLKRKFRIVAGADGLQSIKLAVDMKVQYISRSSMAQPINNADMTAYENEIAERLTSDTKEILAVIQKANCDYLGIGKYLYAYKPDLWMSLDWRKTYPKLKIEPEFQVKIINAGIYDYEVENE